MLSGTKAVQASLATNIDPTRPQSGRRTCHGSAALTNPSTEACPDFPFSLFDWRMNTSKMTTLARAQVAVPASLSSTESCRLLSKIGEAMRYLRSLLCVQAGQKLTSAIISGTCSLLIISTSVTGGTFEAETVVMSESGRSTCGSVLSKATFGPTQAMIDSLSTRIPLVGYRRACGEWIDDQFALPASSHDQVARDMVTQDERV